ncbi:Uncharacterized conserved protein involved in intracellular sulfur reduction [Citrobacter koseri]|nr:Uncharacterized conserved protein involved in intracellular sulfur reduction [Citrobacter koseri]
MAPGRLSIFVIIVALPGNRSTRNYKQYPCPPDNRSQNAKDSDRRKRAAYGSEALFNSLRLAIALREQAGDLDLRLFLMSDAVTAGLRGQKPAEGYNIQQMLEILTAQNVPVKLCKTCTDGRGINHIAAH